MALPITPVAPPAFPTAASNRVADAAGAATGAQGVNGAQGVTGPEAGGRAADGGTGFADAVGQALNTVGRLEGAVAQAGRQAATGDLRSVSDYMIASSEAQLATEITVAIRDRAIAAFNDIMRMQI